MHKSKYYVSPDPLAILSIVGVATSDYAIFFFSFSIHLGPLSIPTHSLTPGAKGLQLQTSGISVTLNAHWHYKEKSL